MNSFNFVKQHDSMQCGIACLSMICSHFGKKYPIEYLSKVCASTSEGVSLLSLKKTAEMLGFECISGILPSEKLQTSLLPCIVHWNQNHFVVLYKIKKADKFYVADPAKGCVIYKKTDFEKHWANVEHNTSNGIALFLAPTPAFYKRELNNSKYRNTIKFLYGYIKKYKNGLIQIFCGLLLGCCLQLIMPFLTQGIVDLGIHHRNIKLIWLILLGELLIVLGQTATDFIRRWILLHISMRINISLVSDFFIKLLKLPMSFFDTKLIGDLLQRMNDHTRVQTFLTTQVLSIMFSLLSFIVLGIVLMIYDSNVFGVFFVGSIIYGIWIVLFLSKRRVIDYELFEKQSINQNLVYQFVTSMQEIKLQDCEQRRRWEWEDTQADLFDIQMKSLKLQQTQEAGSIFINEIKNILITVFAATAVIDNTLSLGSMLAIQYIVGQLNSPVEQLMNFIYSLQDVRISLERINEIHLSKNEESNENNIQSFTGDESINIDHVNFKYDLHAFRKILTDVTCVIPKGKVTAIVGASGSGKTTLIKLMLGYYKVTSGEIKISGHNINDYNLKWWRQHCGVVMQDGVIFSESITRNIAVDDGDVDTFRLEQAARLANIHDYIISLPMKYNTKIGQDGIKLSQGQKQRILIARAVYKQPDFIFLDEATNSLDAKNERAIVKNLESFYKGRTVVVVAHRLSTVKNADQIIVLDAGKVVEIGNHISLSEQKGVYYNLVKNQLELGN